MTGPPLVGSAIELRPVNPERDAPAWYTIAQDARLHQWTGNTVPAGLEDTIQLLETYRASPDIFAWAIYLRQTGAMAGTYWISSAVEWEGLTGSSDAQRLNPALRRTGIVPVARRLVYAWAFRQFPIDGILVSAWEANTNACRSMEAFGFRLVQRHMRKNSKAGSLRPERLYLFSRH
ncbi:MAG: GNAT family N-acetyltransferase [Firmicutes bacterium]|nr:GNAT family N-acetyltransferase [Bacillota bacterium]